MKVVLLYKSMSLKTFARTLLGELTVRPVQAAQRPSHYYAWIDAHGFKYDFLCIDFLK